MAIESKMQRTPIGVRPSETKKKVSPWLWVILILILVIAGGIWYARKSGSNDLTGQEGSSSTINTGEFQAVFLDNGQVYFGKLERSRSDFYILSDVFYLQSGSVGIDQASNLSLTKLGSEAHGPDDKMEINVDHILFIEDMKQDSKVVSAIRDYKNKKR